MKRYYVGELINHYANISVGNLAVLVSKLKEQSPEGYIPCQVNTIIGIPEKWYKLKMWLPSITENMFIEIDEDGYIYKTDMKKETEKYYKEIKWHSPTTMPEKAIRLWFKVIKTRLCIFSYAMYEVILIKRIIKGVIL